MCNVCSNSMKNDCSIFLFVVGTEYGSLESPKVSFSEGVNLRAGINRIALLSVAVGLPVCSLTQSSNAYCDYHNAGLVDSKLLIYSPYS